MSPLNFNDRSKIGSSSWLLKETKGATLLDKFVLNALKGAYITIRVLIRIVLGKKRRDKFYLDKGINFSDFLYDSVDLLGLDTSLFLVFDVPRYSYKFYSMVTRKADNFLIHDMYSSMSLHEDDILQRFSPKEGDAVIDVGAAFGLYTLISSRKVGSGGMVIAIEAHLDSFRMLNRNIKLNNLTNVLTLNYAAYSSMTKLKLYSSYSLTQERAGKNTQKFLEVQARTLDYLLSKFTQLTEVNWIKIDVEGAEFDVLKGANNILSNSKDIRLLIEIHGQDNYEPIVKYLGQYNFETEFEKNYIGGDRHIIFRKYPARDC